MFSPTVLLIILASIFVGIPAYFLIGRMLIEAVNKILAPAIFGKDGFIPLPNHFGYRIFALIIFLFLTLACIINLIIAIGQAIGKFIWRILKPYRAFIRFAFKNNKK